MIILRPNTKETVKAVINSCIRFAKELGLTVIHTKSGITIQEAIDNDDDYYLSTEDPLRNDDFDEFIRMCISYGNINNVVPSGILRIKLSCPNCQGSMLTPKQLQLNTINADTSTYVVCNNCTTIMRISDRINILPSQEE